MKNAFLISAILLLSTSAAYSQDKDLFIGPSFSYHHEYRSKMIYGPGYEERTSATQFLGSGIRLQKKFHERWGLNTGLNYVERRYAMRVPFDHCYFLQPGEACLHYLAHVDEYGYKTIEVPIGINGYLISSKGFELYANLTAMTAFDFQSYYHPFIPKTGTEKNTELNLFSASLTASLGFGFPLTEKLKINFEPFVRLIHTQRLDPLLITGYENRRTSFDNYGGHFLLMYRL